MSSITTSEIDRAIRAVMTGQKYRLSDGTEVTRASLSELQNLREQVKTEEVTAEAQGVYRPIAFGRPS